MWVPCSPLVMIDQATGKPGEAISYFDKAIAAKPDGIFYSERGNSYYSLKEYRKRLLTITLERDNKNIFDSRKLIITAPNAITPFRN